MTIEQFGRRIGLPDDGILCAEQSMPPEEEAQRLLCLLEEDEPSFLREVRAGESPNQRMLALFMRYAAEQAPRWQSEGLKEAVCFDTLRDLTLWYRECMRRTGQPGLVEWEWLLHSLKRRLYRLGRLQYQPRRLKEPLCTKSMTYPAETQVLEVHIPADGKLDREAVEDSFRQAHAFYERDGYALFHCHSWLLSPALHQILTPSSNILTFQEFFHVYGEDFSYRQAEERVFGHIDDCPGNYPEATSLQRALKQFLKSGGKIGMGKGVIPFPGNEKCG